MDSQPAKKSRSSRVRHWKLGIWVGCFLLAISATIPWYETPEAEHYRQLVKIHEGKAVECSRLERRARSAGNHEEAEILDRSAEKFAWFAQVYRIELSQRRLNWIVLIKERFTGRMANVMR